MMPGMGWLPDYPDFRDYTDDHEEIRNVFSATHGLIPDGGIPSSADLRKWCSPVEDQGPLGSCTAHAGVGLIEYYENRVYGKFIDASRLFLYKTTRDLLHLKGDTGAFLRSTIGALALFGVPPEEYWPYVSEDVDKEPNAFCYSFAQNYQAIKYYRHDPPGIGAGPLLGRIRQSLAAGMPPVFGFTVYRSIESAEKTGMVPYPCQGDKIAGGHAVMAVGYDDKLRIKNPGKCAIETEGALLIRNSWGPGWGDGGYGWLPYEYVKRGLAQDFWSVLKKEWVDTGEFSE